MLTYATICSAQSRERSHSRRLAHRKEEEEELPTLCRGRRGGLGVGVPRSGSGPGTQAACFTSTKGQILTLEEVLGGQGAQVAVTSELVRARARQVCVSAY